MWAHATYSQVRFTYVQNGFFFSKMYWLRFILRCGLLSGNYGILYYKPKHRSCFQPEVLDMILDSAEAQGVSQSLVVGQGLGGGAPVHIWNHQGTQFKRTRHYRAAYTLYTNSIYADK